MAWLAFNARLIYELVKADHDKGRRSGEPTTIDALLAAIDPKYDIT